MLPILTGRKYKIEEMCVYLCVFVYHIALLDYLVHKLHNLDPNHTILKMIILAQFTIG